MDEYVIIQKNHIDSINQSKCITINKNNSINQNKLQSNLSNLSSLSTNDSKICVYCKEKFNSRQSLSRHMKHYCKIKKYRLLEEMF